MAWDNPAARDRAIRAIIGEAGGEGPEGWAAVAHVIKNRADSGRWGSQRSVSQVLTPSQFAALDPNSPAYKRVSAADPNSPEYQRIGAIVDAVFDGQLADPTGGADHYFAPSGMRDHMDPDWASKGTNRRNIGNHVFMSLGGGGTPPPSSTNVEVAPSGRGLENSGGTMGVDPRLVNILQAAASNFPGYTVKVTSGERKGDPRFHGKGMATDVQLIDPDGKAVPNYQNAGAFGIYEKFAQTARRAQSQLYPELDKNFRWGGYFSGPKGKYGAADLMHFDLGGSDTLGMAGGSWEKGLNPQQAALFPGAVSTGMQGGGPALAYVPTSGANAPSTGFLGLPATPVASSEDRAGSEFSPQPAQGSKSGWIMPDEQGRIGVVGPKAANAAVPAGTAGVQRSGTVVSQPLPPVRPDQSPGFVKPSEPGGTPLPPFRPSEPGGTPLDLFSKPSEPGGTPLAPYRPTAPGGTPLAPFRPTEPGGTPLAPYRPTEPGGTPLPAIARRPQSLPPVAPQQSWWQSLFGL